MERFVTSYGANNFLMDTKDRSVNIDPLICSRTNGCKADGDRLGECVWSRGRKMENVEYKMGNARGTTQQHRVNE